MKITLNWLRRYVDFAGSPEELTQRLTLLGLEVEGVQKLGGEFEKIVVGEVVTREKHPNADKLSLCRVRDGQGERQIVCGAQNFKPGDKVPLALPGASMPVPAGQPAFVIKVGKIRGCESQGMMCSGKELGLADDAEGLLILPRNATVGQPFAEHLGRSGSDVVYDLEITPNRPDWNSLIGIAREISASTGQPLRLPEVRLPAGSGRLEEFVQVRSEEPEWCPRYTARLIRGVKIGPSPEWLRGLLEKVGLRSINNVVDVTNYVMLETGQPLHAFDYSLLRGAEGRGPVLRTRRAAEGEKFVTLDKQERTLTAEMLLIADETRALALAGIMGGLHSEISDSTRDVLLESANFKPQNIRATSRKLGLKTDASYRFERGADAGICEWASARAAQLILETAGGELVSGVADTAPGALAPRELSLRFAKTNELLGIGVEPGRQVGFLTALGLAEVPEKRGDAGASFLIPSFRVDLKREVDLIEEITRLFGVDKIPSTPPRGAVGTNAFDPVHDEIAEARRILSGLGLNEAQGQTLIGESAAALAFAAGETIALANPLSSDMNVLRPGLLPGLLDSLRHNVARKSHDVALFEIGRVFGAPARESRRVALALSGERERIFWEGAERGARFNAADLKGFLEEFFEQFGLRGVAYARRPESTPFWIESAVISLGKNVIGEMGQLLPSVARHYDLRDAVLMAELDLDALLQRRNGAKSFKALPAFPAIRRDIAMLVPEAATHESVLQAVRQAKAQNLEGVELFDVFRGKNVPAGQKSVAYAFTYRSAEKTLTDAEVNGAHEKLVALLKEVLQATVRE
jgi:phenylalanyl-tRNA synthetase beta chain